jgi:hypothetical protein
VLRNLLVLVTLSLVLPSAVKAQVVINEVLPNPSGEDDGAEWVELYNMSSETVTLKGCTLYLHETNNSQRVLFGEGDFVEKYKVVSWDERWLNNNGDKVRLECAMFNDSFVYGGDNGIGAPREGISLGRSPDGAGAFYILSAITLGEANSTPPTSTPLPTNISTPTPRPTSTPRSTNTPAPTNVPTKTKIPTAGPKEEGAENDLFAEQNDSKNNDVLGIKQNDEVNDENFPKIESEKENFPFIAGVFIIVGFGLISFPVILFLKQIKKI